jgi:pantoate--beta-alanine ligase
VREPDGLALSSRNRYLSADERAWATVLSRALEAARADAAAGASAARSAAERVLAQVPEVEPDYLEILTPDLAAIEGGSPSAPVEARILVAGRLGSTRLIDNLPLTLGPAL